MSSSSRTARPPEIHALFETTVQRAAAGCALGFVLIGLLGFLPAVTSNLGELEFAGHQSDALLLGVFAVSVVHNALHLLLAIFGFAMALTVPGARKFLIGGGVLYLALCGYGLVVDQDSGANWLAFNTADNWLHLGLGVGMIALSFMPGYPERSPKPSATPDTAGTG